MRVEHLPEQAGNPALMTAALKDTLCAHAAANPRALTVMADTLLAAAGDTSKSLHLRLASRSRQRGA